MKNTYTVRMGKKIYNQSDIAIMDSTFSDWDLYRLDVFFSDCKNESNCFIIIF